MCWLGAYVDDVEQVGWAGHHEYELTLGVRRWLPGSVITVSFPDGFVQLQSKSDASAAYRLEQSSTSSISAVLRPGWLVPPITPSSSSATRAPEAAPPSPEKTSNAASASTSETTCSPS
ncbi:hypothetical protein AB1Y20_021579 [Prymnesium parvum]|uniref:Uncharacterized protein n=1 Tax=Prymnesium parvum TaxID=97485 RepID=A0AB34JJ35_PRYPA